ncbi:hypothetical protein FDP22_17730 [Paroceanicella profunda]|uniref:Uncharacterized protein n=1 Tax=Paroceanicella profunda TaxID=2579971 RepID=A0A5B8G0W6_9RHOB|nr:hypothetical protein [Paroceanicella profunda]QDL93460.1 hypothetical protein FDP22_17730 [Paroceanicella profunda]
MQRILLLPSLRMARRDGGRDVADDLPAVAAIGRVEIEAGGGGAARLHLRGVGGADLPECAGEVCDEAAGRLLQALVAEGEETFRSARAGHGPCKVGRRRGGVEEQDCLCAGRAGARHKMEDAAPAMRAAQGPARVRLARGGPQDEGADVEGHLLRAPGPDGEGGAIERNGISADGVETGAAPDIDPEREPGSFDISREMEVGLLVAVGAPMLRQRDVEPQFLVPGVDGLPHPAPVRIGDMDRGRRRAAAELGVLSVCWSLPGMPKVSDRQASSRTGAEAVIVLNFEGSCGSLPCCRSLQAYIRQMQSPNPVESLGNPMRGSPSAVGRKETAERITGGLSGLSSYRVST